MRKLLAASILVAFISFCAMAEDAPLWMMIGPRMLTDAAQPLARHREAEGMRVLVTNEPIDAALANLSERPAYILIVGDDDPGNPSAPWRVPAQQREMYRWRWVQPAHFASDAAWGDMTGDNIPEVPVGRLPARTPEQVRELCRKIIEYETATPTADDLRLLVWAGSANYEKTIDQMANQLLVSMIESAPAWSEPWLLIGDPANPFSGWPKAQPEVFARQMKRGSMLTALIGHGDVGSFMSVPSGIHRIDFTPGSARRLLSADTHPTSPMIIIACHTGDFTKGAHCMTKSFLLMAGGPVAAIGATTESHPLTNFYTATALLQGLNGGRHQRLGDYWLAAQHEAMNTSIPLAERLLAGIEGMMEGSINIDSLKRDQILMYALLGDPATRMRLPERLRAASRSDGEGWEWRTRIPQGATAEAHFRPVRHSNSLSGSRSAATGADKTEANEILKNANARYEFHRIPGKAEGDLFIGTVDQPGTLRVTVTEPGRISTAIVTVER